MSALGHRELPVPEHIDIFFLRREISPSDDTALEVVMQVDEERIHLERDAEELAAKNTEGRRNVSVTIHMF